MYESIPKRNIKKIISYYYEREKKSLYTEENNGSGEGTENILKPLTVNN